MCPWSSLRTKCHVNLFLYDDNDDDDDDDDLDTIDGYTKATESRQTDTDRRQRRRLRTASRGENAEPTKWAFFRFMQKYCDL